MPNKAMDTPSVHLLRPSHNKKRGIGNVLTGDEFDTTSHRFYKGIANI